MSETSGFGPLNIANPIAQVFRELSERCCSCGYFFKEADVVTVDNPFGPVTSCRPCAYKCRDLILAIGMGADRYERIRLSVRAAATINCPPASER